MSDKVLRGADGLQSQGLCSHGTIAQLSGVVTASTFSQVGENLVLLLDGKYLALLQTLQKHVFKTMCLMFNPPNSTELCFLSSRPSKAEWLVQLAPNE